MLHVDIICTGIMYIDMICLCTTYTKRILHASQPVIHEYKYESSTTFDSLKFLLLNNNRNNMLVYMVHILVLNTNLK